VHADPIGTGTPFLETALRLSPSAAGSPIGLRRGPGTEWRWGTSPKRHPSPGRGWRCNVQHHTVHGTPALFGW